MLSVGLGLAILTWVVAQQSTSVVETLATASGEEMAGRIAATIEAELVRPLQIAQTLRDTILITQRSGVRDRAVYLALPRDVVAANRDCIGGWTRWDADGFGAIVPDRKRSGTTREAGKTQWRLALPDNLLSGGK